MGDVQQIDESLPLLLLGIFGMFLLAAGVVAFFLVYQQKLFKQKDKIRNLEKAYEEELLNSTVQAQERERKRIAIDLHDGLGSLLSTIRLYVLQFSMKKTESETKELVGETKSVVDTAIDQTREISHNLLPTTLSRFGVISAIEDFCSRLQKLQEIDVSFTYDKTYQFNEQQNLAIYRIIQELINNTLKHAQASCLTINLQTVDDLLQLDYQDDGRGFEMEETQQQSSGLGMKSIESRVRVLNGKMKIESAVGEGFHFRLRFGE